MPNKNHIEITEHLSLCEALDRVLHKGAVIMGEVTISVAHVDLIYLGLKIVICSVDNLENDRHSPETKINLNIGTDGRLQAIPDTE